VIAEILRLDVERCAREARATNPLFHRAASGAMTRTEAGRYLASMRRLLQDTFGHLIRARDNSEARGDHELARYFTSKLAEEVGHDQWAEQDLARLGTLAPYGVTPVLDELRAYLTETIDRDPSLFLAYILFAEYVTVILGSEFVRLAAECGIPAEALTVVSNHVELDQHHVAEGLTEIDALVGDPAQLEPLREVLATSFGFFQRFGAEVCDADACARAV